MKKLLILLMAMAFLLTGCRQVEISRINPDPSQYWWGVKDDMSISVHLIPDRDGLLPLDTDCFMWQRHEDLSENLTTLDGGEYREGTCTWSADGRTITLTFDDGEVMNGTFNDEGLLLEYDGGFLLDHCKYTLPD